MSSNAPAAAVDLIAQLKSNPWALQELQALLSGGTNTSVSSGNPSGSHSAPAKREDAPGPRPTASTTNAPRPVSVAGCSAAREAVSLSTREALVSAKLKEDNAKLTAENLALKKAIALLTAEVEGLRHHQQHESTLERDAAVIGAVRASLTNFCARSTFLDDFSDNGTALASPFGASGTVKRERDEDASPKHEHHTATPSAVAVRSSLVYSGGSTQGRPAQRLKVESSDGGTAASNDRWKQFSQPQAARMQYLNVASTPLAAGQFSSAPDGWVKSDGAVNRRHSGHAKNSPRTPSLTTADKAAILENQQRGAAAATSSHSRSVPLPFGSTPIPLSVASAAAAAVAALPMSAATALPPRSHAVAPNPAPLSGTQSGRANGGLYAQHQQNSPAPVLPTHGSGSLHAHALNDRSRALVRPPGIGGSEAHSRSASSAASSLHGNLRRLAPRHGAAPGTRSPSPTNPIRGPDIDRRFVISGFDEAEKATITAAIQQLGHRAEVVECDGSQPLPLVATHVVARGTPRSLKALCALVSGRWIVQPDYIFCSLEEGFWLDELEFDSLCVMPQPLAGRQFALAMPPGEIRDLIATVIKFGNGQIVSFAKPAHAVGIIVFETPQQLLDYCTRPSVSE